jgi:quinol monooxygenase YgiN
MIRVIIERRVKELRYIWSLLGELRATAIYEPGYVSGETLIDTKDNSLIIVISTWKSRKHWKAWAKSDKRKKLYDKIEPLLSRKPKIRVCEIMGAEE